MKETILNRILVALLAMLFIPQGMWATYVETTVTQTFTSLTTSASGGPAISASEGGSWSVSGAPATYNSGIQFTLDSQYGPSFHGQMKYYYVSFHPLSSSLNFGIDKIELYFASALQYTTIDAANSGFNLSGSPVTTSDGVKYTLITSNKQDISSLYIQLSNYDQSGNSETIVLKKIVMTGTVNWDNPTILCSNNHVTMGSYDNYNGFVKYYYSVDYADTSLSDVTNAVYDHTTGFDLQGPCTVSVYKQCGTGVSNATTGTLYGFAKSSITTTYNPAQASISAPSIVPGLPSGATVTYKVASVGVASPQNTIDSNSGIITIAAAETVDYSASFTSASAGGVTILNTTGQTGGYELAQFTLTVNKKELTADMMTVSDAVYTGSHLNPNVVVYYGDTYVSPNNYNYQVDLNTNVDVGQSSVTITARNDSKYYSGQATKAFNIVAKSITSNDLTISLATTSYEYDATANTPAVNISVEKGSHQPVLGTDYTVTYTNNINAGTGKATITGQGNYTGYVEKEFTITARSLASASFGEIASQTYTGSAIAPEPTVTWIPATGGPGTQLVKGTDFDFSYTNNVNVPATPNAPPTVTITGKGNYTGSNSKTFTIIKATPVVTAPTAKSLTYTGAAQALVNPGSTTLGTLQYSLDDRTYGTDVPTSTDAGSYTVYYRVVGDGNINDVATQSITATIAKVTPTVTAPTAKAGLLFNGAAQELVNAGSTTGGTLEYSLDNQTYSTTIPSATNVGTYTVYYRVVGNANYNDVAPQSVTATIASSESSIVTYPTANTGLVYNGTAQALITAGSATNGTMQYSLDGQNYSTTIPTGTNAGSYDVWYMVKGNAGYSDVAPAKFTVTIAKAQATVRYNPYEFTAKIGETFYPPYATLDPRDLTLTYWSADKDVATVNAQTGEVTLIAPGKVNIYAEFAGDENYEAAQDYYILTVLQRDIEPIDEDVTILMNDENLLYTDDEGNNKEIKLDNAVIYDILFTLNISGDPSESDGYDETEQCVVLNHPMKENDVNRIITKDVKPGTDEYADEYTGMTFRVPAGKGYVIIDSRTDGEYQMMVKIGNLAPVAFNHTNREKDSVFYECSVPTWVYVYNGGKVSNARMEASHRAKKTKGYVKIYSVTRSSSVGDGIERINMDAHEESDRWYDLQGNRINRPTKKGIYILRGQKVVVR